MGKLLESGGHAIEEWWASFWRAVGMLLKSGEGVIEGQWMCWYWRVVGVLSSRDLWVCGGVVGALDSGGCVAGE